MDDNEMHNSHTKTMFGLVLLVGAVIVFIFFVQQDSNILIGGQAVSNECADELDNDDDIRIDRGDPGCWSDPTDYTTYNTKRGETVPEHVLSLSIPTHIKSGESIQLVWNALNVLEETCSLEGNNGDGPWLQDEGVEISSPLTATAIFTLRCFDLKNDLVVNRKPVNVVP